MPTLTVAHIPDAAWLRAIWLAIYGGDPGDRVAAANILAGSAAFLANETGAEVSVDALAKRFAAIGVELKVSETEAPRAGGSAGVEALMLPSGGQRYQYVEVCFGIPPNRKCVVVQVPRRLSAQ